LYYATNLKTLLAGIAQWDLSVRSQLLQIDRAGGKLFLSQTNQGFQQLAGLPLLQYIQENLKLLGDTPESQKMIMVGSNKSPIVIFCQ
jgi:hypothetical protein